MDTTGGSVATPPAAPHYTPEQQKLVDNDPEVQQYRATQASAEKDVAEHQARVDTLQQKYDHGDQATKAQVSVELVYEKQAASAAQSVADAAKINADERAKKVIEGAPDLLPKNQQ